MSFARRVLTSFPSRSLMILLLLLAPWPGLDRTFSSAMVRLNEAVLGTGSASIELSFRLPRANEAAGRWEILAVGADPERRAFVATALDTRRAGYLHDATFVALTLAMRVRRATKLSILVMGLCALQIVPLLPALAFFSGAGGVQVFTLSPLAHSLVEMAYRCLVAAPGMSYACGGLLWLLLVRWRAPEVL